MRRLLSGNLGLLLLLLSGNLSHGEATGGFFRSGPVLTCTLTGHGQTDSVLIRTPVTITSTFLHYHIGTIQDPNVITGVYTVILLKPTGDWIVLLNGENRQLTGTRTYTLPPHADVGDVVMLSYGCQTPQVGLFLTEGPTIMPDWGVTWEP